MDKRQKLLLVLVTIYKIFKEKIEKLINLVEEQFPSSEIDEKKLKEYLSKVPIEK